MNIRMVVAMGGVLAASVVAAETKVKLEELPPKVQETVKNETKGVTLVGISKEVEKGKTSYEVETKVGPKTRGMTIDADGKVTSVEEDADINLIPTAARQTIQKKAGSGTVKRVEMVTVKGAVFFEAVIENKGKTEEIAVNADGSRHK